MELAHKLVTKRAGRLTLAVAAALLALVLVLVYVHRYRTSVRAQSVPVTVLVAHAAIAKGTPGSVIASQSLYTTTTIPTSQLHDGVLSDPASLRGKVTSREIYQGEQLTAADFANASGSLAASLSGPQRLISVPLDSAHGLIGELAAGDRVDVYAGFNVIPLGPNGTPIAGGQARPMLRLVMRDVPVAAVGSKGGGPGNATTNVSLRVSDGQAAKLAFAADNGKLWLVLSPSVGATPSSLDPVTVETVLLGLPPIEAVKSFGGRP